eukprot:ANDGO_05831.mRNA.1 Calcium-transporting ATPase 3
MAKQEAARRGSSALDDVHVHTLTPVQLASLVGVSEDVLWKGLDMDDELLEGRRQRFGSNSLDMEDSVRIGKLLFANFVNPMSVILGIVAVISAVNQDWIELGVVLAFVFVNGMVGFHQEYGSGKALAALQRITAGNARVLRNGQLIDIPIDEVVVGDVCILEHGMQVPADMRLFESVHLEIEEALLTGESIPVRKGVDVIPEATVPIGDRRNLAFRQTAVLNGNARGIVYAVGMHTQIGRVAASLAEQDETASPLQRRMNKLLYVLLVGAIILASIVFAVNRSIDRDTTLYASAVGIAILPESLLVTITVSMTVGVRRMAKNKAIVRKLASLEILSSLTDICSDKTGTLTEGKMVGVRMVVGASPALWNFRVGGTPLNRNANFIDVDAPSPCSVSSTEDEEEGVDIIHERTRHPALTLFFLAASLCSNASVVIINDAGDLDATGSPTEVALQVLCCKGRMSRRRLEQEGWRRLGEWPFDSSAKIMSVGYESPDRKRYVFVKGAPERILAKCTAVIQENSDNAAQDTAEYRREKSLLTEEVKASILASIHALTSKGLRVLAVASREDLDIRCSDIHDYARDDVEAELTFLGFVGILDPPRQESAPAVVLCKKAGINVRMLTGDVTGTAMAVASTIGILSAEHSYATVGMDFDSMTQETTDALLELPVCIARCSPDTKVKMVKALQRRKAVVLMTGDGVNDAPALRVANVGVAMGSGSDVTKSAADIVLTNDSFAVIVKAIAEGRRIFASLRNFMFHLLSANFAQVLALMIGLAFVDNDQKSVFILSPLSVLFVNFLSGIATMGLAFDKADANVMHRPPETKGVFTPELIADICVTGMLMGSLCLVNFVIVLFGVGDGNLGSGCNRFRDSCMDVARARCTAFATVHILLMLQTYVVRTGRRSVLCQSFVDNRFLCASVLFGLVAILPVIYIPDVAQSAFQIHRISWEWGLVAGAVAAYFAATEIYKAAKRRWWLQEAVHVEPSDIAGTEELQIEDNNELDNLERLAAEILPPPARQQLAAIRNRMRSVLTFQDSSVGFDNGSSGGFPAPLRGSTHRPWKSESYRSTLRPDAGV